MRAASRNFPSSVRAAMDNKKVKKSYSSKRKPEKDTGPLFTESDGNFWRGK